MIAAVVMQLQWECAFALEDWPISEPGSTDKCFGHTMDKDMDRCLQTMVYLLCYIQVAEQSVYITSIADSKLNKQTPMNGKQIPIMYASP